MKYVLITGVSTGIGYEICRYLIENGFFVFGSVRRVQDKSNLESKFPDNFKCLLFDVTDKKAISDSVIVVKDILQENSLTCLINNAGLSIPGPLMLIPDEDFRTQIEINLFGVRNVINAFLPYLGAVEGFKGRPGKIINISSLSGVFNSPFSGSYCVSKHALESMGEIYRRELSFFGIDVVSIQPGPIQSEIWNKNMGVMNAYAGTVYDKFALLGDKIISKASKEALPASKISELVLKIIRSKSPKSAYMVTKNVWIMKIAQLLPDRLMDKIIWKRLNK